MGKIHYEQLIIALKLHFWLRKSWTPANFCQGNAPGISAQFYPPQKLCCWPLLPTDKGTDTFLVPLTTLSVYILQFQTPWLQLHPIEQTRAWGSRSLSTFHSNQPQKDPGFCELWLNTFLVCYGIALIAPKCPQPCLSYPALSVLPYSLSPAPTGSVSVLWRVLANRTWINF